MVSNKCNYRCKFCCSPEKLEYKNDKDIKLLSGEDYDFIIRSMIKTGCKRVMLTGGEPLFPDVRKLIPIVKILSKVEELESFWITTNGFYLNKEICELLYENGLRKVNISVGGSNNNKYRRYSNSKYETSLERILQNVIFAKESGIRVRIDIPLSVGGIESYDDVVSLINKLIPLEVKEVAYFKLHMTRENQKEFKKLYVNSDHITFGFQEDNRWKCRKNEKGQYVFYDNYINIIAPHNSFSNKSNFTKFKCGHYCQGSYAAYLISYEDELLIRKCHREFEDNHNVTLINENIIKEKKQKDMINIFKEVWNYCK
jgi:molybdenum cofactor biosynthesis enzyme MoaA